MSNAIATIAVVSLVIVGIIAGRLYQTHEPLAWALVAVYVAGWGAYALWQRQTESKRGERVRR